MRINTKLDIRYLKKDGTYPLKIAVHRDGKTLYIPLNIYLKKEEWDARKCEVIKRSDRKQLNVIIADKLSQANINLLRIQSDGKIRSLTDKQLLKILSGESEDDKPHYFRSYFLSYIELIHNSNTKRIYTSTDTKLKKFCGSKYDTLLFEDITSSWLKAFDKDLSSTSPSANARAIHMRNIRAVFNAAIDDNLISYYPFRRFEIKYQETAKLALSIEELRRLYNFYSPLYYYGQRYIDIFFLGFFLIGINLIDMANLTKIENGRIIYTRAKTKKLYSIKVEPEAMELIYRYRGKKKLISVFETVKSYRCYLNNETIYFRKLEKELGINHITYYSCRHSWATIASELDIPDEVISLALGHSSATVTDIYIRRNIKKVDEANRKVIDYLLEKL